MVRGTPLLALGAVSAVLAGCGAGTSKADYVKRADQVCAQGARRAQAIPAPGAQNGRLSSASAASYIEGIAAVIQQVNNQLKALPRPSQDRVLLDRYLAALDQGVASLLRLDVATARRDRRTIAQSLIAL